ncbi:hypothetical protein [Nocardioides panzhihuensis]|uniref:Uncharacterized protein n=1 Tax=Nocardioides panzhihuensis TaxID=860243 RepID=A0A7Z0DRZ1_9ACTN|nr:hypothetical protein [Nocardioides panzhihuensis]NYI80695.1 hypothetical protein [Nocardioides panzhihuensis]
MDADVVPGSVTDWTVTIDDQRRLKRALMGLRVRSGAYWLVALGVPVLASGFVWLGAQDAFGGVVSDTFAMAAVVAVGVLILPLNVAMPLVTVRRRVERELPVGATLTPGRREADWVCARAADSPSTHGRG